jgi:hypothetical protein
MRWLVLLLVLVAGCSSKDADQLGRVCRKAVTKLDDFAGGAQGKLAIAWDATRGSWSDRGIDGRVMTRLRWDKNLDKSEVHVDVPAAGTVRLTGKVVSDSQRRRAVEVAESTSGVEKVVDELTRSE